MSRFDILSLFPGYFKGPFEESILKRAQQEGKIEIHLVDIRDFADNKWRKVDDRPYGGGPGMVLMAEPVVKAIRSVKQRYGASSDEASDEASDEVDEASDEVDEASEGARVSCAGKDEVAAPSINKREANEKSWVVYLTPQGSPFNAKKARELAQRKHVILVAGHYEGIDERAIELEVDEELSIGDYVLSNGCLAAIAVLDATARFIPGVLGHEEASAQDSFEGGLLDCPHYTRPEIFEGLKVPPILLSGDHKKIAEWRRKQSEDKTRRIRPEILE